MKNKSGLELLEWIKKNQYRDDMDECHEYIVDLQPLKREIKRLIAEEKAELSLAELAYEKEIDEVLIINPRQQKKIGWTVLFVKFGTTKSVYFNGKTYAEAKTKTREYLEGLK